MSQIDHLAFYSANFDNLVIAEGVTEIPDSAFCNSTILNLSLPKSVSVIGKSAFESVRGITSLTLPDAVILADRAFNGSYITMNNVENAKSIGRSALEGNNLPTTIEFKQIEKLDFFALGSRPDKIVLPATLKELGARNAKHYQIDKANQYFHSEHGIAYNKDKTRLIDYPTGAVHDYWPDARMHYYIYIPEGVKEIGDYAINDNEKDVYLPSTLEYVGNYGLPHWNATINCYAKKAPYFANYMPGPDDGFYDNYYVYKSLCVPYGCSYSYKEAADSRGIKWGSLKEIDPVYKNPNESLWGVDVTIDGVTKRFSYLPDDIEIRYEDGQPGTDFCEYYYDNLPDRYALSHITRIDFIGTQTVSEYLEISKCVNYTTLAVEVIPLKDIRYATFTDNSIMVYSDGNRLIKKFVFEPLSSSNDYYSVYYSEYDGTKRYKVEAENAWGYHDVRNLVFDQYHEFRFDIDQYSQKFCAVDVTGENFRNEEFKISDQLKVIFDPSLIPAEYANLYIRTKDGLLNEAPLSRIKEIGFAGDLIRVINSSGAEDYSCDWHNVDIIYMADRPRQQQIYDYSDPESRPRHTQFIYIEVGDGWKEVPMVDAQDIPFDGTNLIIDGVNYPVSMIKRISLTKPEQRTLETYKISDLCPQVRSKDYTIKFSPTAIDGEETLKVEFRYPEELAKEEGVRRVLGYEITLGDDIHELNGVVEIRIPMEVSDDCIPCGMWYNTETQEWEAAFSYYDEVTKEGVIIADHLTWYGMCEVTREHYRNGKVTYMLLPNVEMKLTKLADCLQELAVSDKIDTEREDQFLSEVSDYLKICGDVSLNTVFACGLESETLQWVSDNVFYPLSLAVSVLQIVSAAYNERDAEVAGNTLKLIFNEASAAAANWVGSTLMTGCMASVAWLDYVLNKVGTTAWETRTDLYRAAMSKYYSRGNEGYRSYADWYKLIYPIYTRPGITIEQLKSEVDKLVDEHSWKFWTDESTVAYYLNEARNLGWSGGGGLNDNIKKKLSDEYYDILINYEIKTVMEQMQRKFQAEAYNRASDHNKKAMKWFNTVMTLDLYDATKTDGKSKFAGCKVRFKVMPSAVKDPQKWEVELDAQGNGKIQYRMLPFLLNGFKPTLVVVDKDGHILREIEYLHGDKGAKIDISSGLADGIRWENANKVSLNIKMDPPMFESDVLMRWTGQLERCDDYGNPVDPYEYDYLYPSKLDWSDYYGGIAGLMYNTRTQLSGRDDEKLSIDYSGLKMDGYYDKETRQGSGTFSIEYSYRDLPNNAEDIAKFYRLLFDGDPMNNPSGEEQERYLYGNTILEYVMVHKLSGTYTVTGTSDGQFAYHFIGDGTFEINGTYLSGLNNFIPLYLYDDIQPVTDTFKFDGKATIDETFIY